jgi:hypothetical protein
MLGLIIAFSVLALFDRLTAIDPRRPILMLLAAVCIAVLPTGSVVAVYAWYPNRYGAKDAFRIGNYSLLEYMGGNIKLEFFYTSPRSWLSRIHRCSRHVAPDPGSSR